MRTNPFLEAWLFVTGQTPGHAALGAWRFLFVAFTIGLVLGSIGIAMAAWRRDPSQGASGVVIWFARSLIGAMWLEGSLWKLPLPGGLPYWLGLMGQNAAFDAYGALIQTVLLPNVLLVSLVIWLTETTLAVCLMLGIAVRAASLLGCAMALNLWIGLFRYQPEWPWIYVFIALLHALFFVNRAGRALGLDSLARDRIARCLDRVRPLACLYRWAS